MVNVGEYIIHGSYGICKPQKDTIKRKSSGSIHLVIIACLFFSTETNLENHPSLPTSNNSLNFKQLIASHAGKCALPWPFPENVFPPWESHTIHGTGILTVPTNLPYKSTKMYRGYIQLTVPWMVRGNENLSKKWDWLEWNLFNSWPFYHRVTSSMEWNLVPSIKVVGSI